MSAKILLTLCLLFVALELSCQCQCDIKNTCDVVVNTNPICRGKVTRAQCICDFTCSEWDKPCNWAVTCPEEIEYINKFRREKNKLIVFRLPNRSHQECLEINIKTHNQTNCCNKFCSVNLKDVCF